MALSKPSALAAKKVVVWACSTRDLEDETVVWEQVPLPDRNASSPRQGN